MLETVVPFHPFCRNFSKAFFNEEKIKKNSMLFHIEVSFFQFNASLLNRSINFVKIKKKVPDP